MLRLHKYLFKHYCPNALNTVRYKITKNSNNMSGKTDVCSFINNDSYTAITTH